MLDLLNKPLPKMPPEIARAIQVPGIEGTPFDAKNRILSDAALQREIGYHRLDNGTYQVSMICPMPGITPEMIEWWFWWHPQADERYRVWFPGDHIGISYAIKDRDYFTTPSRPVFRSNTQFPRERINGRILPLRIDFVPPEEFGFSRVTMAQNDIPLIVCGHVGVFGGLIWHTEMAHIFKQTDDGLCLISRFWIGQTLTNPLLRRLILKDSLAKAMAEHCCIEYRNLAAILPRLFVQERP